MRSTLLWLVACVLLLSLAQDGEGRGLARLFFKLKRIHHFRILQHLRLLSLGKCNTENNCGFRQCCVRDINEDEDGVVTFERLGECVRASALLNETDFTLNRIDDEIAAAADRPAELGAQAAGQDLFILCRAGTLGPQPTPEADTTGKRASNPARQLSLKGAVRLAQGKDVAVAVEIEAPTTEAPTPTEAESSSPTSNPDPIPAEEKRAPMMQLKAEAQEAETLLSKMVDSLTGLF